MWYDFKTVESLKYFMGMNIDTFSTAAVIKVKGDSKRIIVSRFFPYFSIMYFFVSFSSHKIPKKLIYV